MGSALEALGPWFASRFVVRKQDLATLKIGNGELTEVSEYFSRHTRLDKPPVGKKKALPK
jgi:hypothetical protein